TGWVRKIMQPKSREIIPRFTGLLELLRKFVRAALDPVVRQSAVAHLPNGEAGKLHGTVISRCAEHASVKTSDGPTGNNAAAVNAAEHIVADQTWFADFAVKALIHSLNAAGPTMSAPALVI